MREVEFGGGEVEHGGEVFDGAVAPGFAFGGGEDGGEGFEEGVGETVLPVGEDAIEVGFYEEGDPEHGLEDIARGF